MEQGVPAVATHKHNMSLDADIILLKRCVPHLKLGRKATGVQGLRGAGMATSALRNAVVSVMTAFQSTASAGLKRMLYAEMSAWNACTRPHASCASAQKGLINLRVAAVHQGPRLLCKR